MGYVLWQSSPALTATLYVLYIVLPFLPRAACGGNLFRDASQLHNRLGRAIPAAQRLGITSTSPAFSSCETVALIWNSHRAVFPTYRLLPPARIFGNDFSEATRCVDCALASPVFFLCDEGT